MAKKDNTVVFVLLGLGALYAAKKMTEPKVITTTNTGGSLVKSDTITSIAQSNPIHEIVEKVATLVKDVIQPGYINDNVQIIKPENVEPYPDGSNDYNYSDYTQVDGNGKDQSGFEDINERRDYV